MRAMTHLERTGHERTPNKHGQCAICVRATPRRKATEGDKACMAAWRAAHPEYHREWRAAKSRNPDWITSRREYKRARQRHYRQADPQKHGAINRVCSARRRARLLEAPGAYTAEDVLAQLGVQRGRCYWCTQKLSKYHVDHVIPLCHGGSNGRENIVVACPSCNLSKRDRMPEEFAGRFL